MSGVYLIVWDELYKDASRVLRTTKGGYPHLTIAYTGKEISVNSLKQVATNILAEWMLKPIVLERAEVMSFEDRPGHIRNDVLLIASDETQKEVEETRNTLLRNIFANHAQFTMRKPHVTYGIYEERGEAERVAQELNEKHLPFGVVVTGVTID